MGYLEKLDVFFLKNGNVNLTGLLRNSTIVQVSSEVKTVTQKSGENWCESSLSHVLYWIFTMQEKVKIGPVK